VQIRTSYTILITYPPPPLKNPSNTTMEMQPKEIH